MICYIKQTVHPNIDIKKSALHNYFKNNFILRYITQRSKYHKQNEATHEEFIQEFNENIEEINTI